jgi:alpha-galactosidase
LRELSPSTDNAPTFVIDAGWSPLVTGGGPYDCGTDLFPDMPGLANEMREIGVRPGIWMRPLLITQNIPESWGLPSSHPLTNKQGRTMDPSVPEVLQWVRTDIERLSQWGYGLIKHDFTTYDIFGRWGFQMGADVTSGGWTFADRTKTTAEIIHQLYVEIRDAAGDNTVIIGCNTVGHLSAGLFELQRIGDDTSGRSLERTRKMGINSLAFRMPQHESFFAVDADCVGLTRHINWEQNRLWLDMLSRSGTPLFVSADPDVVGPEQRAALREAFGRAALPLPSAEPIDWMDTTCPRVWRLGEEIRTYDWETFPGSSFACPP